MYKNRLHSILNEVMAMGREDLEPYGTMSLFTYGYVGKMLDWLVEIEQYDEPITTFELFEVILESNNLMSLVSFTEFYLDKKFLKDILDCLENWFADMKLKNDVNDILSN